MRYALISDIHGNAEALTSVLKNIEKQKIDKIYSLGDVIGYGCNPSICLDLVDKHCDIKLMGNHEYYILGLLNESNYNSAARESAEWTKKNLNDNDLEKINSYQLTYSFDDIFLVHASPYEPEKWLYVLHPEEALLAFQHLKERICFCGHSHVPMIFTESPQGLPRCKSGHDFQPNEDYRYIINIGAVGQPRDNDARACYVTLDTETWDIEYHRVEYDVKTMQSQMAEAKMPEFLIERLAIGR